MNAQETWDVCLALWLVGVGVLLVWQVLAVFGRTDP